MTSHCIQIIALVREYLLWTCQLELTYLPIFNDECEIKKVRFRIDVTQNAMFLCEFHSNNYVPQLQQQTVQPLNRYLRVVGSYNGFVLTWQIGIIANKTISIKPVWLIQKLCIFTITHFCKTFENVFNEK